MIIDTIFQWVLNQLASFLQSLEQISPPSWYIDTMTQFQSIFLQAGGLRNWVNLEAVQNSIIFLLACYGFKFTVQLFRMLLSYATGGGGNYK